MTNEQRSDLYHLIGGCVAGLLVFPGVWALCWLMVHGKQWMGL